MKTPGEPLRVAVDHHLGGDEMRDPLQSKEGQVELEDSVRHATEGIHVAPSVRSLSSTELTTGKILPARLGWGTGMGQASTIIAPKRSHRCR
jgi:hypothetical protein